MQLMQCNVFLNFKSPFRLSTVNSFSVFQICEIKNISNEITNIYNSNNNTTNSPLKYSSVIIAPTQPKFA